MPENTHCIWTFKGSTPAVICRRVFFEVLKNIRGRVYFRVKLFTFTQEGFIKDPFIEILGAKVFQNPYNEVL